MADFEPKEKAEGLWNGREVKFNRNYSGHRFTDEEVTQLLNGEEITCEFVGKNGPYKATGKLEEQEYNGNKYVGFSRTGFVSEIPDVWCEHTFTPEEKQLLRDGQMIRIDGFVSKKGNVFSANIKWVEENGRKRIVPIFDSASEETEE